MLSGEPGPAAPQAHRRHCSYRCLWHKHSSGCRLCFQSPDPAPLISKLAQRYTTAANKHERLFHRPIALTLPMSVNIDIRGQGGSATLTTSRMSVYFTDAGNIQIQCGVSFSSCVCVRIYVCKLWSLSGALLGHMEAHIRPVASNPKSTIVLDIMLTIQNSNRSIEGN